MSKRLRNEETKKREDDSTGRCKNKENRVVRVHGFTMERRSAPLSGGGDPGLVIKGSPPTTDYCCCFVYDKRTDNRVHIKLIVLTFSGCRRQHTTPSW